MVSFFKAPLHEIRNPTSQTNAFCCLKIALSFSHRQGKKETQNKTSSDLYPTSHGGLSLSNGYLRRGRTRGSYQLPLDVPRRRIRIHPIIWIPKIPGPYSPCIRIRIEGEYGFAFGVCLARVPTQLPQEGVSTTPPSESWCTTGPSDE